MHWLWHHLRLKKFHSEQTPQKQKVEYLRLIKEINESMSQLTSSGPWVLEMQDLTKKTEMLRINMDVGSGFSSDDKRDKYEPLTLIEQE